MGEKNKMAFENAIITKEDDEKYGLSEIYYKYNPYYKIFVGRLDWTIDRVRNCWLWKVYNFPDYEYDHNTLEKAIWILYSNGDFIEVVLDYEIDKTVGPKRLHRIWQLLGLSPMHTKTLSTDEVISILNESLETYGEYGYTETMQSSYSYSMEIQNLIKEK
ncbi:hypothetical protein [uncultured Campylobacter sp.]|uniref:hypothetical protein n=1 Tax=uncultured Campylobacter sp. TaxID=218934 RepID=UPI0026065AD7|nr:hypothetical protein [uncultured Campylobacter sp.]